MIIKTKKPYGVIIGEDAMQYLKAYSSRFDRVLVVIDKNVYNIYGNAIKNCVQKGEKYLEYVLPYGEACKTKENADKLLEYMVHVNMLKSDLVVAFGGGATLDLCGFCAGIYKRGVPYINIPTTLLATVDASIGGKTAIDFGDKKNIIGLINQPSAVFCNLRFLESLDKKSISSGYAEVIKCGLIGDSKAFTMAERGNLTLKDGIYSALKVKAKIVKRDERDLGERKLLNFGHTLGHAIESASNYILSHGESVAIGMVMECVIAERLNLSFGIKERLIVALKNYGLKTSIDIPLSKLLEYIKCDKKRNGEYIEMALPVKVGKCKIFKLSLEQIKEAMSGR